ncbi:MAG: lipoyl(octanoyl) transferase LipB [Magnetococcales bacterium]|nr:lipoyl(octanoyl) transferase LipB [Magnetococcales bacterium]
MIPVGHREAASIVHWCRFDQMEYAAALALQKERVAAILRREAGAQEPSLCPVMQLILLEHPPVYTMGRSGQRREVLHTTWGQQAIPVVETDRGGRVTYHGPGQLVVYVICDLRPHALASVRRHVFRLEEVALRTLAAWGVEAHRDLHHPGVWVGEAKIGALGVRIHRGIAYHGLALNRDLDLSPFRGIIPCGLDRPVTSLADLGLSVSRDALERQLLRVFPTVFPVRGFVPPLREGEPPEQEEQC